MKRLFLILPILLLFGCKATLEQGGSYAPTDATGTATQAPDIAFYAADGAYDLAYSAVTAVFDFEKANRAALWKLSPDIKHSVDKVRTQAAVVHLKWAAARKAYLANPIPANLSVLEQILAELQAVSASAAALIPAK